MEGLVTSASLAAWLAEPASRVAVIGASGCIGSAIVDRLLAALPSLAAPHLRLFGSANRTIDIRGRSAPVEPLWQAAELGWGDWLVRSSRRRPGPICGLTGKNGFAAGSLDLRPGALRRQRLSRRNKARTRER